MSFACTKLSTSLVFRVVGLFSFPERSLLPRQRNTKGKASEFLKGTSHACMIEVGAYELGQRDSCKMGELEAGIHSDPVHRD